MEINEVMQPSNKRNGNRRIAMTVLVVSLSINVFMLASLAMYGAWLLASAFDDLSRDIIALAVWISTFGASGLAFWKIVHQISMEVVIS